MTTVERESRAVVVVKGGWWRLVAPPSTATTHSHFSSKGEQQLVNRAGSQEVCKDCAHSWGSHPGSVSHQCYRFIQAWSALSKSSYPTSSLIFYMGIQAMKKGEYKGALYFLFLLLLCTHLPQGSVWKRNCQDKTDHASY